MADELNDVLNASQRPGTLAQIAMDELRFTDAVDQLRRDATHVRELRADCQRACSGLPETAFAS